VRPLHRERDAATARVALVASSMLLLDGDEVRIVVEVGANSSLEIVEPAGTVAHRCDRSPSRYCMEVHLAQGARLRWVAAPFVCSEGAEVIRDLSCTLEAGAQALLADCVVLGRSGQRSGVISLRTSITEDGLPILRECLDLGPERRLGILPTGTRALATLLVLGTDAPEEGPVEASHAAWFTLPGRGHHLLRAPAPEAHLAQELVLGEYHRLNGDQL
jgi:urease accessory protein